VSKSYRMIFGVAAVVAVLAVGGIAAAEQGGNSADHRQSPTTTTEPAVDTATPTSLSLPPQANSHADEHQSEGEEQGQNEVEGQDEAATPDGLCEVALWNASDQGVSHGEAFSRCSGYEARLEAVGVTDEHTPGGAPENAGSQGEDNGQGQGAGPDNPNAQGHGKP